MSEERWLTVRQVAERLQTHEQTVRRWLRAGELRGALLSDQAGWRIREADLEVFLRQRGWRPQDDLQSPHG